MSTTVMARNFFSAPLVLGSYSCLEDCLHHICQQVKSWKRAIGERSPLELPSTSGRGGIDLRRRPRIPLHASGMRTVTSSSAASSPESASDGFTAAETRFDIPQATRPEGPQCRHAMVPLRALRRRQVG